MLRHQLARRNLTDAMRVHVALQLKPFIEAKAKAEQKKRGGGNSDKPVRVGR